ncbi:thiamine-phosphate kinase [Gammaproteobacteria bacterium]|nr:thiamine-phosphate kinase [Gammaproteobacteria bacterium]
MALSEFEIISTYFNKSGLIPDERHKSFVPLGIGDDCALLAIPEGKQLAISMDVLVADIHFPHLADPTLIAQRALAVNLSDLAAMGAAPLAFTLGLTMPTVDESWLSAFSEGLSHSAQKYNCPLVGGDMSKGPLSIAIQAHGSVATGKALQRSGAKVGDKIYVTGALGAARMALDMFDKTLSTLTEADESILRQAYYQPEPRLETASACLGIASAAIDLSDGLLADLGHIAKRSDVGMIIEADKIPVSVVAQKVIGKEKALQYALGGGDDYELALTVPEQQIERFALVTAQAGIPLTYIGHVIEGSGVSCRDGAGNELDLTETGYQHF